VKWLKKGVKERRKENIIIVKLKTQQDPETIKKLIKEKVDVIVIKKMTIGIRKFKKGSNETIILDCETGENKITV